MRLKNGGCNVTIKDAFQDMKFIYNLIAIEGKIEYKDEFICVFQIINNNSVREVPKKYRELYKKLAC